MVNYGLAMVSYGELSSTMVNYGQIWLTHGQLWLTMVSYGELLLIMVTMFSYG